MVAAARNDALPARFVLAGGRPVADGRIGTPVDLLVTGGRIAAVATPGAAGDWRSGELPRIDVSGYCLAPAPGDAHVHLLESALLRWGVDLAGATTVAEVLERLAEGMGAVAEAGGEGLCWAHSLEPGRLREGEWPRLEEVERAVGGRPLIMLQRDGHASLTTAAADRVLEARAGRPLGGGPSSRGARVGSDHYLAFSAALAVTPDAEKLAALDAYLEEVAALGVTRVHAFCGCPVLGQHDSELVFRHRDRWPVEVRVYPQSIDPEEPIVRELGRRGGCLLVDGAIGARTAALRSAYHNGAGADAPRGRLYFSDAELRELVAATHFAGHQLVLHAVGDRAVDQVLAAMRALRDPEGIRARRHRIEHAVLLHPEQVEQIAELGLVVGVQPAFHARWGGAGGEYEVALGEERASRTNDFHALLAAGVPLAGGSDAFVTPLDPWAGMRAAVQRRDARALSAWQAMELFTSGVDYAGGDPPSTGWLKTGEPAELVLFRRHGELWELLQSGPVRMLSRGCFRDLKPLSVRH